MGFEIVMEDEDGEKQRRYKAEKPAVYIHHYTSIHERE